MQKIHHDHHIVWYNDYEIENNAELLDFLKNDDFKKMLNNIPSAVNVVLGWDGTMLRAIKENYHKNLPFLGINFWHKWFLLNGRESITWKNAFSERKYPLIEVEICNNGEIIKDIAVNEIDIRAWHGKMIALDVSLSQKHAITIEGDGLIIATPAGSTGYNSSLGWPIIPHNLNAFVMTPKAAWKPRGQSPILIHDSEIINISHIGRKVATEIYCDGRELLMSHNGIESDIFIKKSVHSITLLIAEEYINTWDNKVFQEQGFQVK